MSTPATSYETIHRGRPRDPARDRAILDATIELVATCGYDRTTVDGIAAHAGVSKPTIYRRWPGGKDELVAAAICERKAARPLADTGSLRGDLLAVVEQLVAGMREHAHLAAGLTQQLRQSPELARVFREHVIAEERSRFVAILERAVARGDLPRMPDAAQLLADVAPALVHTRGLITGDPLDSEFAAQLVDRVLLPALTPTSGPKDTHR